MLLNCMYIVTSYVPSYRNFYRIWKVLSPLCYKLLMIFKLVCVIDTC